MARVVADSGVEDIVKRVSSEKYIADDSHAFADEGISPEPPQVSDSVNDLFLHSHFLHKIVVIDTVFCEKGSHLLVVPLYETNDSFSEILRDILCLVLQSPLHPLS
jgi:hypothetical protein